MYFNLSQKFAEFLDIILSSQENIGLTLIIAGLTGLLVFFILSKIWENEKHTQIPRNYLFLENACQIAYSKFRKSYKDKDKAPKIEALPYYFWRNCPMYGIYDNSTEIEPLNNVGNNHVPFIKDFNFVRGVDPTFNFDQLLIKKSDLKIFTKEYLETISN